MKNYLGATISNQNSLENEAIRYFKEMYRESNFVSIDAQLHVIKHFPRFLNDQEGNKIGEAINSEGIGDILNKNANNEILCLDEW